MKELLHVSPPALAIPLALLACSAEPPPEPLTPDHPPLMMAAGGLDPLACVDASTSPEGFFRGSVYHIPLSTVRLPDFDALTPLSTFCTPKTDVTTRESHRGFPGVTEHFEWFAVDYKTTLRVTAPGEFRFRLTSDDGARLFINGVSVIDMDGQHGAIRNEGKINLAEGNHALRLSYFQPRTATA